VWYRVDKPSGWQLPAAREKAAEAHRRKGTDTHIRAIVARAGKLTPEQIELLRSVLPEPADDVKQAS
jgi:hypothetical protein